MTAEEKNYKFADEADLLNVALFGKRATDWRKTHTEEAKRGENIRDYASAEELIILINLENFNAEWIAQGLSQQERLQKLRSVAYSQMEILQQQKEVLYPYGNPMLNKEKKNMNYLKK